jgi:hypothetical protein
MAHLVAVEIYLELIAFYEEMSPMGPMAAFVRRNVPYGADGCLCTKRCPLWGRWLPIYEEMTPMGPMAAFVRRGVPYGADGCLCTKKCPLWGRRAVVRVRRNDPYGPVVGV